ncbi:MAG: ComEC/Rec2 family competence protein [Hydrogenobaculum sp.]
MKSQIWPNIFLYPALFLVFVLFLAFVNIDNKSYKTHLKDGFYKIEAKVLNASKVKILYPPRLNGEIVNLNIKLPKDSYIRGYIKVKNGVAKTSKDLLEISKPYNSSLGLLEKLKMFLKSRFRRTTSNDWSKDIGLALLFGEGAKALPEDLLTSFSANSLIFLLIMSGIHIDMIFKNMSNLFFGEYKEVFGILLVLLYVGIFMEHGAPIVRAVSYLAVSVLLKALYRYAHPIKIFFISSILTLCFNVYFYKSIGFWLSVIITFYILLYIRSVSLPKNIIGKILLSMELSLVAILSSMPVISRLGPISILAVLVVPFLLIVVELYLVFGFLNILTVFSIPLFYIPLNKIAYYFGDFVYSLNLMPMYFKIPVYYGAIFDGLLLFFIVFIKDRFVKLFSMVFLFGLAYALWSL